MNKKKLIELRCKAWGITEDEYYCNQCADFSLEDMTRAYRRGKNKGRAELEKKNKQLEHSWNLLMTNKADNEKKIADLEFSVSNLRKDNKELREVLPKLDKENDELKYQLTNAKELIENVIRVTWGEGWNYSLDWKVKAEQFLSEVEK